MIEVGQLRQWIASDRMPWRQDGKTFVVMSLNVLPLDGQHRDLRGWILLEDDELSFETEEIILAHSEALSSNT